jgi:hypothetical protein
MSTSEAPSQMTVAALSKDVILEKQGNDELEQLRARDLLSSEVQSLVTENDLKEIEDKIIL